MNGKGGVDTGFSDIYNPTTLGEWGNMAVSRILFDLQNLDLQLDEAQGRVADIERSLGNRDELKIREEALEELRGRMRDLDRQQRSLDLTSKSARDKIASVEAKLYGGGVGSPRELQDLSKELVNVKKNLHEIDEEVLENLMSLEETEQRVSQGEEALLREEEAWSENQHEMELERRRLSARIGGLEQHRRQIAKGLDDRALEVYERVRRSRAGRAVVLVERGLCRACGVTLPTHSVQRARSGSEPVQCGSCGSILYSG